jgi:hypothetical protein
MLRLCERRPSVAKATIALLLLCLVAAAPRAAAAAENDGARREALSCGIAIVGGGFGGVYTAFRLATNGGRKPNRDVCLFEKEDRLGGRVYDVALDPAHPELVIGTGALRIMETQDLVFALADELGITYEAAPYRDDLISARGFFGSTSDELNVSAYPLVPDGTTETDLYDQLRFGPERANAATYPDFRSYVRAVDGEQGYHFLTDMFRFRGDFEYPIDTRSYLDFLDEEWDVCCTPSYPVGGMSEFIKRMSARATEGGARIFLSDPVQRITKQGGARPYRLVTANHVVSAKRVVIATETKGLQKIGGSIGRAIHDQPQFTDILGVKVAVIVQRWPNAWWLNAVPGKDVRRAWTTEHCLNFIEIPIDAYSANQLATRSVYDDDARCVAFWENTASRGTEAVEAEITRGLRYLFPDATIPQPLATVVQIWPEAWHWLRGGSSFTNAQTAEWAVQPLPGEDVSLVGESYNPQRAAWVDAALKSSINTLNARYGFDLPTSGAARIGASRGKRPSGR